MSDYHYSHICGSWTPSTPSEPRAGTHCCCASGAESFRPVPLEIRLHSAELTEGMAAVLELASQAGRKRKPPPPIGADRRFGSRFAQAKTPEP